MPSAGMQMAQRKRTALADCNGLLERACEEVDRLVRRGHESGLDIYEVEELTPLTQEVVSLRARCHRLEDELSAIASEWAAD